jgi:hypothetical protein
MYSIKTILKRLLWLLLIILLIILFGRIFIFIILLRLAYMGTLYVVKLVFKE